MAYNYKATQLGVQPGLPKKVIPGTKISTDNTIDYGFVLTEEDKTEDDFKRIKELVYYYEWIARQQINAKRDKVTKLMNLANGIIDVDDYIKDVSEYETELTMLDAESLDYDLKFYPIIPNIVNTLVGERFKQHVHFTANAINREAVNEIIEAKNNDLRELLLRPLQEQFNTSMNEQGITPESQPDIYQQQLEIFQKLPQVQKYYSKEYRLEIEKWANHQIQIDKKRFKLDNIEREVLRNKVICDLPFIHINLLDNDYTPHDIDPRYTAWLRSPYSNDVSKGVMFAWFEYESPINLITRFGNKLREEDIEKLQNLHTHYRTLLTIDSKARYNLDTPGILEAAQNYLAFREIAGSDTRYKDSYYRGDEYKERLVQITNMYLQVPRKMGKLTMKIDGQVYSTIVDDKYKVTYKPIYNTDIIKEKNDITLVEGEHLEWFYINELWRCVKLNLSTNPNPDNSDDIFLVLEKFPVQIPEQGRSFGSMIPVFGGPVTNRYNGIHSIVNKCAPWQVMHNYLWNRNEQLLQTEIGKFFAINQNVIPQESMGEEWGPHNMVKFALNARDNKIAPIDSSLMNTGQSGLSATGGYGQLVDLTVTDEVIQKAKLAEMCRNECYSQVGISPQFLGDISPQETATGVTQGINRSITQLKYLYDEHLSMMEDVYYTMLEFARYLAMRNESVEQIWINDEGERQIFKIPSDLLIHQLGIFINSGINENIILENMKNLAMNDNTMGSDALEKASILGAKSIAEIYDKLRNLQIERAANEEKAKEAEHQREVELLQQQKEQLDAKVAEDARQKQLDRESNERIAEIRAIGASQLSEGNGFEELSKLRDYQLKEQTAYTNMISKANERIAKSNDIAANNLTNRQQAKDSKDIELEKLRVKREEIAAGLIKSANDLKIAKENKP